MKQSFEKSAMVQSVDMIVGRRSLAIVGIDCGGKPPNGRRRVTMQATRGRSGRCAEGRWLVEGGDGRLGNSRAMEASNVPLPSRSTGLPLLLPMTKGDRQVNWGRLGLSGLERRRKGRGAKARDYREARDRDSDSSMFERVGYLGSLGYGPWCLLGPVEVRSAGSQVGARCRRESKSSKFASE